MARNITLITGASGGIGEALAHRVARDGRHVALAARRRDRLEDLATKLRADHGIEAYVFASDLSAPGAARALADAVDAQGLTVDWLINNAGFGTYGLFHELPIENELAEIQLNVAALVELTHRFLPGMVSRRSGAVINVASVAGFAPGPFWATYSATKAFVKSFSEAIAAELRSTGVHVLCVCPGFTRTEFQERADYDTSDLPSFIWMSADTVADQTVRAVGSKTVLVNGTMNSMTASFVRLMPPSLLTRVVGSMMKPKAA
jgi:short-subunit dehydrogenase